MALKDHLIQEPFQGHGSLMGFIAVETASFLGTVVTARSGNCGG